MNAQFYGKAFYLQCNIICIGLAIGIKQIVILLNGGAKVFVYTSYIALHKWRCKVGLKRCIGATFSNYTLTDISNRIDIEMWHCSNQYISPIIIAEGNLFFRSKLQTSVRSEMNHHIGFKTILRPKI